MKAIRVSQTGGTEVLQYVDIETPEPGPGEALVRIEAIGVNFIDVYHRTGLYKMPLPFTPGSEGAGVVEAIGDGVDVVKVGDRVAFAGVRGAYAEFAIAPADKLVPLPDSIDAKTAAAAMLQGMTAHYLVDERACDRARRKRAGPRGGGRRRRAAGADGEDARRARVRDGVDEASRHRARGGMRRRHRLHEGRFRIDRDGGDGREGMPRRLRLRRPHDVRQEPDCCGLRATLALFGQSSGVVPPFEPGRLAKNGVFLTRPSLGHYTATREELLGRARDVFEWIASGALKLRIDREVPLRDVAEAHRALEARETTGKVLLIP